MTLRKVTDNLHSFINSQYIYKYILVYTKHALYSNIEIHICFRVRVYVLYSFSNKETV